MCVATRCHTIDQFVATFQRYCEASAIFIPNAQRDVGTILPFSFELVDETSVFVGLGKVVEEFTTVSNRFGRAGIVVSVQKLKRESIAVFKRMLAERNQEDLDTPPPAFARAMTAPIAIDAVRAPRRPTNPIQIPDPGAKPSAKPRASTVLGMPTIPKLPSEQPVVQIPTILPTTNPVILPTMKRSTRSFRIPDATPRPVLRTDAIPDPVEAGHDTVRDEFPFALRNELRLLEERAPVVRCPDIDVGWDTPVAAASPIATEQAHHAAEPASDVSTNDIEPARDIVANHIEPARANEGGEAGIDVVLSDAVPLAMAANASASTTVPNAVLSDEELMSPWWRRPLRWVATAGIAATLLVGSVSMMASIDAPTLAVTKPATPAAPAVAQPAEQDILASRRAVEQPKAVAEPAKPVRKAPAQPVARKRARAAKKCASLDCL